ncbi:MAG: 2-phospho-L-lactate guanylyltransferase [Alphaproteobacteria bacterium]|nr:2-phospho-L-lactate guanylyltransferase [Alphaproteobacteria bacterium]
MKAILIPIKLFNRSKQRLAAHFSERARTALAEAMCSDFFRVIAQVRGIDRVYIVSQEARALDMARSLKWDINAETEQHSESRSVDAASRYCQMLGVRSLLRLPMDLPLAQAGDIEAIFAKVKEGPCAVLVPSRGSTGTNALLRSPPTLFPSHFGPGSFARHVRDATRAGARVEILRLPRIALDIDEIEDLHVLRHRLAGDSAVSRWLAQYLGEKITETSPSRLAG